MKSSSGGVSIVGGGSWGTALALQAARSGHSVRLWITHQEIHSAGRNNFLSVTTYPSHIQRCLVPHIRHCAFEWFWVPGYPPPSAVA